MTRALPVRRLLAVGLCASVSAASAPLDPVGEGRSGEWHADADLAPRLTLSTELSGYPPAAADDLLLQRVAAMLDTGKTAEARALLAPLRARPEAHLEAVFLSGMLHAKQGDLAAAAGEFRLMLARDARLARPRLELARVLFLDRDYEGARYHFEQVLASDIPAGVRPAVQGQLAAIRERVPSFSLGMEIISDSNPKQSTSSKTVTLGGLQYQLSDTAPGRNVWGLGLSAGGRVPLPADPSWFVRASVDVNDYPHRDSDFLYAQGIVGKHLAFERNTLTLEAGGHYSRYRQEKLYAGELWRLTDQHRQNDRLSWQFALEVKRLDYPTYTYLDGRQRSLSVDLLYAAGPASRWQAGIYWLDSGAREAAYAFRSPGGYARYVHEWEGGLITGVRLQHARYDYRGTDPFFAFRRDDRETRLELDLVNRNWQFRELSPRLVLGVVDHASNIALYDFRRTYLRLGASREF